MLTNAQDTQGFCCLMGAAAVDVALANVAAAAFLLTIYPRIKAKSNQLNEHSSLRRCPAV